MNDPVVSFKSVEAETAVACTCGGAQPDECCPACEVYHALKPNQFTPAPEWQPIETAPKDGTCVIVWPPTWGVVPGCAWWDRNKHMKNPKPYWSRTNDMGRIRRSRSNPPTHWMPLPAPPEVGK